MKVAHKYPFKYQVNDLAFSKDGSKLYICTGNGEGVGLAGRVVCGSRARAWDVLAWVEGRHAVHRKGAVGTRSLHMPWVNSSDTLCLVKGQCGYRACMCCWQQTLPPALLATSPTAAAGGQVEVHSFPDMRRVNALMGHTAAVFALASDRQQRWLATGGADAVTCLWDTQVGVAGMGGCRLCLAAKQAVQQLSVVQLSGFRGKEACTVRTGIASLCKPRDPAAPPPTHLAGLHLPADIHRHGLPRALPEVRVATEQIQPGCLSLARCCGCAGLVGCPRAFLLSTPRACCIARGPCAAFRRTPELHPSGPLLSMPAASATTRATWPSPGSRWCWMWRMWRRGRAWAASRCATRELGQQSGLSTCGQQATWQQCVLQPLCSGLEVHGCSRACSFCPACFLQAGGRGMEPAAPAAGQHGRLRAGQPGGGVWRNRVPLAIAAAHRQPGGA